MNILKKLMGAVAATLLLAAVTPTTANAIIAIDTFTFSGQCDDCEGAFTPFVYSGNGNPFRATGDGEYEGVTGTLMLTGFTPDVPLETSNFFSFEYNGSNILDPFIISSALSLSGTLDADGHVTSDFELSWSADLTGSPECEEGTCTLFVPEENLEEDPFAMWFIGTLEAEFGIFDVGITGTFASVPEPATIALFGMGLAGLGFARRRRGSA